MIAIKLRATSQPHVGRNSVFSRNICRRIVGYSCIPIHDHQRFVHKNISVIPTFTNSTRFSTSAIRGVVEDTNKVNQTHVEDVPDTIPQEFLVEHIPEESEWAGCSRKFMAPLQITVRGAGTVNILIVLSYRCFYSSHSRAFAL